MRIVYGRICLFIDDFAIRYLRFYHKEEKTKNDIKQKSMKIIRIEEKRTRDRNLTDL